MHWRKQFHLNTTEYQATCALRMEADAV